MSIDKATVLAELERIVFPRRSGSEATGDSEGSEDKYERSLAFLALALEENEDMLYGLFWNEYNSWLVAGEKEQRYHSKWFMRIFDGIVQKPTHRALCFAGGLLLNPHYPARDLVAEGLGRMGSLDAYPYLVAVVHHDDFQIATRVLRALGEIKAVEAEPILLDVLFSNTHTNMADYEREMVRAYALEGLQLMDTPTAWQAIEAVATHKDFDDDLRDSAIHFLVTKKGATVIPLLQRLASDASLEIRDTAVFFLNRFEASA